MEFTIALSLPICIVDDWGRDSKRLNVAGSWRGRLVTQLQFYKGWERTEWGVYQCDVTFRVQVIDWTWDWGGEVEHIIMRWWSKGGKLPGGIDPVTSNAVPTAPAEAWGVRWNRIISQCWQDSKMVGHCWIRFQIEAIWQYLSFLREQTGHWDINILWWSCQTVINQSRQKLHCHTETAILSTGVFI